MFFLKIVNFCSVHGKQWLGPITARESQSKTQLFYFVTCFVPFLSISVISFDLYIFDFIFIWLLFSRQCHYCFVWTYQNNCRALIGRFPIRLQPLAAEAPPTALLMKSASLHFVENLKRVTTSNCAFVSLPSPKRSPPPRRTNHQNNPCPFRRLAKLPPKPRPHLAKALPPCQTPLPLASWANRNAACNISPETQGLLRQDAQTTRRTPFCSKSFKCYLL